MFGINRIKNLVQNDVVGIKSEKERFSTCDVCGMSGLKIKMKEEKFIEEKIIMVKDNFLLYRCHTEDVISKKYTCLHCQKDIDKSKKKTTK